jgi:AcrR family transcriptional regulator
MGYGLDVDSTPQVSMAERKRQLVSNELSDAALLMLAAKGFDAVTIDEIAAAAGVSRRTFFRYFASKEDVVVQFLAGMGADIVAELTARPAGEPPSVALRHAVRVPLTVCVDHSERSLQVLRLILGTPALLARYLERQAEWRAALAVGLADRVGLDPATHLYPRLAAAMALAALDAVLQRWDASNGTEDPNGQLDDAFAVIAPALDGATRPSS